MLPSSLSISACASADSNQIKDKIKLATTANGIKYQTVIEFITRDNFLYDLLEHLVNVRKKKIR